MGKKTFFKKLFASNKLSFFMKFNRALLPLVVLAFFVACHSSQVTGPAPKTPPPATVTYTHTTYHNEEDYYFSYEGILDINAKGNYREFLRFNNVCEPCNNRWEIIEQCGAYDQDPKLTIKFKRKELPSKAIVIIEVQKNKDRWNIPAFLSIGMQCELNSPGQMGYNKNYHVFNFSNNRGQLYQVQGKPVLKLYGQANYMNDYDGFYIKFTGGTPGKNTYELVSYSDIPEDDNLLDVVLLGNRVKVGEANVAVPGSREADRASRLGRR